MAANYLTEADLRAAFKSVESAQKRADLHRLNVIKAWSSVDFDAYDDGDRLVLMEAYNASLNGAVFHPSVAEVVNKIIAKHPLKQEG